MTFDDASLVERSRKGDQEALVLLYERYQPLVFTYLSYRTTDQEVAEDLTAEVFLRMVTYLDTFQAKGRPVLAWLYTIARNLLVDHYRRNGKAVLLPLDERQPSSMDGPSQLVEQRLSQETLRSALALLTEDQRQVVLLKFIHGQSNAEISALLNKPEGAIKSLQHRALAALRRRLEKEQDYEIEP